MLEDDPNGCAHCYMTRKILQIVPIIWGQMEFTHRTMHSDSYWYSRGVQRLQLSICDYSYDRIIVPNGKAVTKEQVRLSSLTSVTQNMYFAFDAIAKTCAHDQQGPLTGMLNYGGSKSTMLLCLFPRCGRSMILANVDCICALVICNDCWCFRVRQAEIALHVEFHWDARTSYNDNGTFVAVARVSFNLLKFYLLLGTFGPMQYKRPYTCEYSFEKCCSLLRCVCGALTSRVGGVISKFHLSAAIFTIYEESYYWYDELLIYFFKGPSMVVLFPLELLQWTATVANICLAIIKRWIVVRRWETSLCFHVASLTGMVEPCWRTFCFGSIATSNREKSVAVVSMRAFVHWCLTNAEL